MCASTSVVSTPGNRRYTLAIATSSISVILKIRAHLKFSVSGRSKQASIHMHVCNEVTLVWGSLRLTPITSVMIYHRGASLSKQHTDLLCTKQDLSHTKYADKSSFTRDSRVSHTYVNS